MKKYKSNKTVGAEPICEISKFNDGFKIGYKDRTKNNQLFTRVVQKSFFARGMAEIGDYLVEYEEGYMSWCPKDVFEKNHTPLEIAGSF